MTYIWLYFLLINGISAVLFCMDKYNAIRAKQRISERTLYLLQLLGGFAIIIPLMFMIRHKNRKANFYLTSFLILLLWIASTTYFSYGKWWL